MNLFTLELPTLYGDHHVIEVRRILLALPGVEDVYASSAFHLVEIKYDPRQVTEDTLCACLNQAGYLGEMPVAAETAVPVNLRTAAEPGDSSFFRHTAVMEASHQFSFTQKVPYTGRPLWPCPGMGPANAPASTARDSAVTAALKAEEK